ncbi:G2/mitotic-specific cyclin-A [Planococcus citri]|uniref:G2/mitotic-specific cyclin-A n=1 Tax=Planococcus citri TaxID=170843 RepID=UPI0031F83D62
MDLVYNDQENIVSNFRRLRSHSNVNRKSENQIMKRSVLGVINADSNKIAPAKSKNEATQKSIPARGPTYRNANSFKIFEDKDESTTNADKKRNDKCKKESPSKKFKDCLSSVLELPPKLISCELQSRQPLKDVFNASISSEEDSLSGKSYVESPMSVDKTLSPIARPKSMLKKLYDCDIYSEEILSYLKTMEKLYRPKPNYMKRQPDVSYSMRTILVDWLVEVAEEYKLQPQTLFLAVSFIDRFLSLMSVVRSKLQLLGTAAMFVASKYEEIYPPDVGEFVFITDDTYSQKQVLRMEYLILKVLAFDISGPTAITFVQHFSVLCEIPEKVLHLTTYLCELMLLEGDPYLAYPNSMLAASATLLSRYCLEYSELWPENYAKVTGYQILELSACVNHLNTTHVNAKTLQQQAVNNKYNSSKFLNVTSVEPKSLNVKDYISTLTPLRRSKRLNS